MGEVVLLISADEKKKAVEQESKALGNENRSVHYFREISGYAKMENKSMMKTADNKYQSSLSFYS